MVKIELLIHGLKNCPWAASFMQLCQLGEKLLDLKLSKQMLLESSNEKRDAEASIQAELEQISYQQIGKQISAREELEACISAYPKFHDGLILGPLNATPTYRDMQTLGDNESLSDDIIRAVLGAELANLAEPRTVHVVDPSYIDAEAFDQEERQIDVGQQISDIIVPMHHGTPVEHWTICHVDLKNRKATHYDSYHGVGRLARLTRIIRDVIPVLPDWCQASSLTVEQGDCAVQEGNDCGVHVLANGIEIMRGNTVPSKIDGVQKRVEYAHMILRERWASITQHTI